MTFLFELQIERAIENDNQMGCRIGKFYYNNVDMFSCAGMQINLQQQFPSPLPHLLGFSNEVV